MKGFLKRIFQEIMKKKKKKWRMRRLVNETIVPVNQQASVLYCTYIDGLVRALVQFHFNPKGQVVWNDDWTEESF